MTRKLSKLLLEHDSMQEAGTLAQTYTPNDVIEVGDAEAGIPQGFDIPADDGQSTMELQDEAAPNFLRACLHMANRAMLGQTDPFKEGDLPQKMVIMLAHKMLPSRKVGEVAPQETPKKNKETARALKHLINTLSSEVESDSDIINSVDGVEVASVDGQVSSSRGH